MKNVIRGEAQQVDTIQYWLEIDDAGDLRLKCSRQGEGVDVYSLLYITEDRELCMFQNIPRCLGFKTDSEGVLEPKTAYFNSCPSGSRS